jgi:2-haloacid dehalogenase
MLNFRSFEALTFDCYGTLIDWENGILRTLRRFRDEHGVDADDERLLVCYSRAEAHAQNRPYRKYREVLRDTMRTAAALLGVEGRFDENALVESLPAWEPFADTVAALAALRRRYRLGIISNVDDDLFAHTAEHLATPFDWVVTAEQVGSYKPSQRNFRHALRVMDLPMQRVLHVAQSKFHDIAPARAMGWATVWVDRRHGCPGSGATQHFDATADVTVPDMASLVRRVEHQLQTWDR